MLTYPISAVVLPVSLTNMTHTLRDFHFLFWAYIEVEYVSCILSIYPRVSPRYSRVFLNHLLCFPVRLHL